jgi:rubrerythrin
MAVLDDAIVLEKRAREHYEKAGKRVSDSSAGRILEMLADEERKHAELLEAMKRGAYGDLENSSLLQTVRGLIEGAVEGGQVAISTDASMREVLQRAMEIEQETERFYKEHAKRAAEEKKLQELFEYLAKQEAGHSLLVGSLAEYFNRPAEWVESAEFGLRPEY